MSDGEITGSEVWCEACPAATTREAGPSRLVRALLLGAGTLSLALGVVGVFLPLLPTTPFLLLAAWLYARSSRRFYRWLMQQPRLGGYIRNYREGRGISLKQKIVTLALLWATISASAIWAVDSLHVRLLLVVIAVGVTTHLLRLPTLRA